MLLFPALLAAIIASGCGGLAGEPQVVSTMPPVTPIPTDTGRPDAPPDIALGAQIFAEHCTRCHGVGGKGDGEKVQSGEVPRPLDFTDPATGYDQSPANWFSTITNGNIEHLMPPWRDELTDAERWAVAMYTYTLPYSQEQIARGQDLFKANCAQCDASAYADLGRMASLSQRDLEAQFSDLPGMTDVQGADRDAAAYARTIALANPDAIGTTAQATAEAPNATQEVSPASVTVAGQIANGTALGSVPPDLQVTLFVFDASLNRQQQTASADADGHYSFADVPFDSASTYVVTTDYRDRVFASDILSGDTLAADAADGTLDLPVTIYELTEDPDVIQIVGLVSQVTVVGEGLQVAQVFSFTNTSDRAFTSSQNASNGQAISVVVTLPPGAIVAGFADNQNRYVVDQDNFTVYDTIPVLPGEEHIVQLIYLIPYNEDAIIEQPMNYTVNGPVRLLLNPPTIKVTSDQLPALSVETVGSTQYQSYGGTLALQPGDVIRYEVSGQGLTGAENADRNAPVVAANNLPLIVVGALVIAGLLVGGLFLIAARNRSGDQQVIDILIRQIAELDTDHAAGKIPDDAYERQRNALKTRLAALMERKK